VLVGSGDDTAVLETREGHLLLLACDMMVEGIHFRREWATPRQIGWKAMAQNLSDIAAMGGLPSSAVVSLAASGDLSEKDAMGVVEGLTDAASQYGASVVGGDLVGSPGPLIIDVAVTGWVTREHLLCRRGASPGDVILVTGELGRAAAGLAIRQNSLEDDDAVTLEGALKAHHEPIPRLAEGQAIAATDRATAMMDLSDGIADDLPRLCAQSGVGARVRRDALPVAEACRVVASRLGIDALQFAVSGGEDYELMFTCPPVAVQEVTKAVKESTGTALTVIGEIISEQNVLLVDAGGREIPLGSGYDHFSGSDG